MDVRTKEIYKEFGKLVLLLFLHLVIIIRQKNRLFVLTNLIACNHIVTTGA